MTTLQTIWNRVKTFVVDAGAVLVAALGLIVWWKVAEKDKAKAEVKDSQDQQKINNLSQDETANNQSNAEEAAKRVALEQQLGKETSGEQLDQDAILRIINNPPDQQ